jgi:hypothetical protein
MTHAALATSQTPSIKSGGYVLPLIGSLVLTLAWLAYTAWVSLEIISQSQRS